MSSGQAVSRKKEERHLGVCISKHTFILLQRNKDAFTSHLPLWTGRRRRGT